MGRIGGGELLLILFVALLIFGPSKLADMGKGLGEGLKNFKKASPPRTRPRRKPRPPKPRSRRTWQRPHVQLLRRPTRTRALLRWSKLGSNVPKGPAPGDREATGSTRGPERALQSRPSRCGLAGHRAFLSRRSRSARAQKTSTFTGPPSKRPRRWAALPAARYGIPPERPVGSVLVASSGLARVGFDHGGEQRMLAIRLVVSNNSDDVAWTMDTREQRAIVLGAGETRPVYANADAGLSPLLQIPRGKKTTVDLFYPLPAEQQEAKRVPQFDFIWQVQTGERLVAERTPFERQEIETEPYPYGSLRGRLLALLVV